MVAHSFTWIRNRGRMIPAPAALVILLSLLLIACDETVTRTPTAIPTFSGSEATRVALPTPAVLQEATIGVASPTISGGSQPIPPVSTVILPTRIAIVSEVAWGSGHDIARVPANLVQDYELSPGVITPDGQFLVCPASPTDFFEGSSRPAKVILVNVETRNAVEIHTAPVARSQAYEISADDNWIVWTEAPQEPGFFSDWTIYAYNRNDQFVKEVAKAPRNKIDANLPVLGPDGTARVDHGIVVWNEGSPDREKSAKSIVKSMDLTTGQIKILTENGLIPRISWPHVIWAESQDEPSTQIKGANKGVIVVLNLQTGVTKKLQGPDTPKHIAIYKESLVWVTAQGKEVMLTDLAETSQEVIAQAEGDELFTYPSLNDRLIAWYTNMKPQVWDRVQKRIVAIENERVFVHFVSTRSLVWMSPISREQESIPGFGLTRTINVLDTTKLPK